MGTNNNTDVSPPMSHEDVRLAVILAHQRDSRLQVQALGGYLTEDVILESDVMGKVVGRGKLQNLLRALQLLGDARPEVKALVVTQDKALVLLVQHIAYRLLPITYWRRVAAPSLISLSFDPAAAASSTSSDGVCTAGAATSVISSSAAPVVSRIQQCASRAPFVWMGESPVSDWVWRLWLPRSGAALALLGRVLGGAVRSYNSSLRGGAGHIQALAWAVQDAIHLRLPIIGVTPGAVAEPPSGPEHSAEESVGSGACKAAAEAIEPKPGQW